MLFNSTLIVDNAGISHAGYTLQTLGNAIYFITSVIAALLYGNIGMKVLYAAIFRDVFKFPPLETTKGKWTWAIFGKQITITSQLMSTDI